MAHQLGSKSHGSTGLNAVSEMKRPALRRGREARARIRELATRRVEAAWTCASILRPDLPDNERKALAQQFLDFARERYRPAIPLLINPAQVRDIVWRNSQCANRHCSMVLFSREIAEEMNEFFNAK
jgi:hypothetical protein